MNVSAPLAVVAVLVAIVLVVGGYMAYGKHQQASEDQLRKTPPKVAPIRPPGVNY